MSRHTIFECCRAGMITITALVFLLAVLAFAFGAIYIMLAHFLGFALTTALEYINIIAIVAAAISVFLLLSYPVGKVALRAGLFNEQSTEGDTDEKA